jgi:hypothetical protein
VSIVDLLAGYRDNMHEGGERLGSVSLQYQ